MPPSPARRCTWVLVFFRKSSPELLTGFTLFGSTLPLVPFLLQFAFICLFWELAQSLGSRWHKPGPSAKVLQQVRFHCVTVLSPFNCQALAHPLSHVPLFWRGLAVCPAIGHSVRGCLSTKTSAGVGGDAHTHRKGLTFRGKLFRFVFRPMCFLRLMKGRWAKKSAGDSEQREGGLGWLFHLRAGPTGVFVKVFSLVREELRWGSVWLDAQWECCLCLFDVPGPFSLIPSLPSGLFALHRD